ncbi:MurR/RpiR family transcriptional regulator [Thermosipho sp. (in: thermotogales)]|jgi:DNA-binding MurR/RpiR family transcriptional regulator|uniref:MurR/RpiR family transcriptional regulator n=1 Tax=Thermosipho sp. (in: thermotogales) TaxID=1968895 RepID=UPI002579E92B|nr:MurR/RpiR family transcriptional regulator [Thermosipho sp. (in: thermotogales)]MBZ4650695.1 transcriptional regulator, RpiR family [Thermosipho sp. (in: thermotogales)]
MNLIRKVNRKDMEDVKLGIIEKLKAIYDQLKPAERKIARYIINYPDDVIHHSISELSELAKVGEATISRISRKLGYKGFQALKIELAKELSSISFEETKTNSVISEVIESLNKLSKIINENEINQIAKKVVESNKIFFFGVGSSGVVAEYGALLFTRGGFFANYYNDPHMQVISAAGMDNQTVVFGISSSGNIRDTVKSMKVAKDSKAFTVAITGGYESKITEVVDKTIYIPPAGLERGMPKISPIVSQISILHMIFEEVLSLKKEAIEIIKKANTTLKTKKYASKNEKI